MTLAIDLTAEEELRLQTAAQQEGIAPAALARKLATEHLPRSTLDCHIQRRVEVKRGEAHAIQR